MTTILAIPLLRPPLDSPGCQPQHLSGWLQPGSPEKGLIYQFESMLPL
jgi:hypothetical protein